MTRIILVRHGQSEANLARRWAAGKTDAKLTELGQRQAELVADYLTAHEQKIDAVYASPLSRATDTVRPTAERLGLSVIPEEGIREIYGGLWENQPISLLRTDPQLKSDYAMWHNDLAHCRCTEGESIIELYERASAAVLRLAKENEGKTLLLGTHWTPTVAILTYANYGDVLRINETPPPFNASIHVLCYKNGSFVLEKQNVVEHLGDLLWSPPTSNETEE
jgi:broad specificity phosphatase PhoE